jgi:hypothetical protein
MKAIGFDPAGVRAEPRPARFSLAANYDLDLVPAIAAYPVEEVYGKFPSDGVSGGRPRYMATPLSESDLRHYIRLLAQHGIAFNYLLNGACFGNHEWTHAWQKRATALLNKLGELGVSRVTIRSGMRSGSKWVIFSRRMKSSSSVGQRALALSEF